MRKPAWQRSSFCGGGGNNCIEVAADDDGIAIRESSEPDAVITIDRSALHAFVIGVKGRHFDHLLS
ncbi:MULTISPECIES: DUF397 domain-containing protein [Streptomyces]|uniref:DUF397 domain-containing protein n=1 Tax=Streptomyces lycopersici TaxID=2974589 RepID=UPI0021D14878|nr:DUF397 domain-containing protein [Streptomyces sp. NEAU-383]